MDTEKALAQLRKLHDDAARFFDEHDQPGEWLDADGSWKDWESESEGSAAEARRDAFAEALALFAKPDPIVDAVGRVQRMRDEAAADYTEDEAEQLDSEPFGRHFGALDTFDRVLDVLQALAHDLTPAQGGEPS